MAGRYGTSSTAQLPVGMNGHALARMYQPQPWKAAAACSGVDPDLFYPEWPPTAESRDQAAEAKRVCRACPVRLECLAYALATGEELGIWGGLNERERRRVRRLMVLVRKQPAAVA